MGLQYIPSTPSKYNQFSLQAQILLLRIPLPQLPPCIEEQAVALPPACPASTGADQGASRGADLRRQQPGLGTAVAPAQGGGGRPPGGLSCLPWPGHQGLSSGGRRDGILLGEGGRREPLGRLRGERLQRSVLEHPVILVNLGSILSLNPFLIISSESTDVPVAGVRGKKTLTRASIPFGIRHPIITTELL